MAVPVMQVRVVRMGVAQRRVAVPMRMRFADRPLVRVPVVCIVSMVVLVFERLVRMLVLMAFGEMHPKPEPHQETGEREVRGHRLVQEADRQHRPDKRRERKIGAGARRPEMTQCQHKQDEAYPYPEKADRRRGAH